MSAQLAQFTVNFEKLSHYVVASEGDPSVLSPCPCGKGDRTTRCKDCVGYNPTCDACFFRNHEFTPFHFAEKWNGRFFDRSSQSGIGRVLYLGHDGRPCPSVRSGTSPLHLDVVQLNGVHGCRVQYCECAKKGEHWEQLLEINLFPATLAKPATAYALPVLKHFDLLSSISKTSAMDFVTTIRRSTNNAFPDDVPVSLLSFLEDLSNESVTSIGFLQIFPSRDACLEGAPDKQTRWCVSRNARSDR